MDMTRQEKREYDRWRKRFEKYGFDIREAFAKEWHRLEAEKNAHIEAEKYIFEGGIFLSCANCGNMFYVTSYEIQQIRAKKMKRPELCERCVDKVELARIAHQGSPYKNRIVDNMGRVRLDLVGTGERRWEKGIREANRYSYELPESSEYDRHNKELVEWVNMRAEEGLRCAKEKYNAAEGRSKRYSCGNLAPFIWILEGPLSVDFINCIREYLELPLVSEDSLGYTLAKRNEETIIPKQEPVAPRKIEISSQTHVVPKSVPTKNQENSLKDYFQSKGLTLVDKRPSGGCLWVVGNEEQIQKYTDEASKLFGISGCFCNGGKATSNKRSWYTKSNK